MTRKKEKFSLKRFRGAIPYVVVSILTIALAFFGSLDKAKSGKSISLDSFVADDYTVSTDQLSELYVVAGLSDALGLASASDVAANYVVATTMHDAGQATFSRLEKPPLTNLTASRGVVKHIVEEGESMDAIAQKYGVTTDQIRWSNGLKTTAISAGTTLYVPSKSGIVYTVKSGETVEGIAEKYGSNAEEIIALNDLEVSGVSEGMRILIKDGTLPEKERPEYVPPVVRTYTPTYSYTYSGSVYGRQNLVILAYNFYSATPAGNPGARGNCTWYAWYWRATDPRSLGALNNNGRNARTWHYNYAYRGVGRTPAVGAVFQTPYGGGGYGHVGVVTALNDDGSITVQEMNYLGYGIVNSATIPADQVGNFNYIY